MPKRRGLRRETLEIYLVHLLMAYRRITLVAGLMLLWYAISNLSVNPPIASASMVAGVILLMVFSSYTIALYTARFLAWLGTLWTKDD